MTFRVQIAHGDCHPETCACNQYEIVDEFHRLRSGPHSCCVAESLCAELNSKPNQRGKHINAHNHFQSVHHPDCPAGYVPLSTQDPLAQDLLYGYALRKLVIDPEFAEDLIFALQAAGYDLDSYKGIAR